MTSKVFYKDRYNLRSAGAGFRLACAGFGSTSVRRRSTGAGDQGACAGLRVGSGIILTGTWLCLIDVGFDFFLAFLFSLIRGEGIVVEGVRGGILRKGLGPLLAAADIFRIRDPFGTSPHGLHRIEIYVLVPGEDELKHFISAGTSSGLSPFN